MAPPPRTRASAGATWETARVGNFSCSEGAPRVPALDEESQLPHRPTRSGWLGAAAEEGGERADWAASQQLEPRKRMACEGVPALRRRHVRGGGAGSAPNKGDWGDWEGLGQQHQRWASWAGGLRSEERRPPVVPCSSCIMNPPVAGEKHPALLTCTAPVNIAVVKYWGKRDEKLILPINSSLSVTLHQDQLKTTTTAALSRDFTEDCLWLNGKPSDIEHHRLQSCLREIRRLARKRRGKEGDPPPLSQGYKVHIASENNFPTAAGLASSAAGYACLVYTLARLYGVEGDLSEIARQGSGSACRSMFGGFVQWVMGDDADGKDSVAQQVVPETHWPELRIVILVVSAEKKPVGSTAGMQKSVKTSLLLKHRAKAVVPERMVEMIHHIQQRDFEAFGQLTMKESNQFHATCLDTFPPIFYLNDVSKQVIALVHRFNAHCGKTKVAYTFDAGPNAVLFLLDETLEEFVEVVKHSFPPKNNGGQFLRGLPVKAARPSEDLLAEVVRDPIPGAIQYLLITKPGPGPAAVDDGSCHLLGADGMPRNRS